MALPVQNINHSAFSMTPELHRQFKNYAPYKMLQELKSMFEKQAGVERFVRNYNKHNMGKTISELHAMLIEYEKGLPKKAETPQVMMIKSGKIQKANKKSLKAKGKGKANGKGKDKQVYIPKPKNPKPTAKEHPAKDDTCYHCKEVGHWKRNRHVYLVELLKKKKQVDTASSSGIFTIELFAFSNKSWVYDIGCGTHICITKHEFREARKLKQGALYLYVGNGDCRLAHISKKRIEKMQQEGLLKSIDDELFDQFVSCLLGKITRKSFPHRLERATGLLGIIHTDVCGSLRHVSRQGASYFITFTDDYRRYGYVIFLSINMRSLKHSRCLKMKWKINSRRLSRLFDQIEVANTSAKSLKSLQYASQYGSNQEEVSGRAIDLEEIQDEDTLPSEISSKIPMEVEGFELPQEEEISIRGSERSRRVPNRLCLNVKAEEHNLGDLNEPTSYKAAMLDPESNKWLDAMNGEMQSMVDNMVWVLVDLPLNCKTVGSKWIFKKKTNMYGIVHIYKACLVVKGYTQLNGVDYEETFSPVADIRAIRILISIAAFYDYEIWQMDVKTAFLNSYLDEDIYMVQPEGFVDPKHPRKVCKLQRSIYGLKQVSRSWNKRFDDKIKKFCFAQNLDEPYVYQKASGINVTFLILYVDVIIIMGNHISSLQSVKDYFGKCFAMKYLREAHLFLESKFIEIEGKGKGIATDEQAAHSLLDLHKSKKKSAMDQFILQKRDQSTHEVDAPKVVKELGKEASTIVTSEKKNADRAEDQAGPTPGNDHEALAGSNPEPMNEDFYAVVYPKNLDETGNFEDHFINDNLTEDERSKPKANIEVISSVTVLISQAETSIPMSTSAIDISSPQPSLHFNAPLMTATTETTTILALPPPPPSQSSTNSELAARVAELEKRNTELERVFTIQNKMTNNLASRIFTLDHRDLEYKIDNYVCKLVKEYVQTALRAPLLQSFQDLSEGEMKEML
nr:retrotransposon protein, putative, Ty1-copia subclass [Tanacetum cinerariifolium]